MLCPHCNYDLDGELIYETFIKKGYSEERSIEIAEMYGATKTSGKWQNEISVSEGYTGEFLYYMCPACKGRWKENLRVRKVSEWQHAKVQKDLYENK